MKRIFCIAIIGIALSLSVSAQDSIETKLYQKKIGIGMDLAGPTLGPHLMYYNNAWLITATYGFPKSSTSDYGIKEYNGTIFLRGAYAIGYIHGTKIFWPIYLGVGYTHVFEKNNVAGFKGEGTISGYSFFTGFRMFEHNTDFLSGLGSYIEFGYTKWTYTNSVLYKNQSSLDYKYPAFFFSIGVCVYLN